MIKVKHIKKTAITLIILLALFSCSVFANSTYDLRDIINIQVKNQEDTGACWTLAMNTALETNMAIKNRIEYKASSRHMDYGTSQSFTNQEKNPYGFSKEVNTGGTAEIALAYLTNGLGPIQESEMPFTSLFGNIELKEVLKRKSKYQVEKWVTFPNVIKEYKETETIYKNEEGKIYTEAQVLEIRNKIKKHIIENGAIYTGAHVLTDFKKYYNSQTTSYYCNDNTKRTDHALVIIGWDDNYSKENFNSNYQPKNNGAYLVQNSWGNDSRLSNGTYYISYEDFIVEQNLYGIETVKEKKYENIYQYDVLGRNQYFEVTGANEIYGANVFEKKETHEIITQIGINSYMDVGYEIYINPKNEKFELENIKKVSEGNLEAGYNTINLSKPMQITGEKFAIIVKYKRTGETLGVTSISKYAGSGPYANVTSKQGQSYLGVSIEQMEDLYLNGSEDTNLCIKAFSVNRLLGDINGDGRVSATDLSQLKLHLVNLRTLENLDAGDLNNDGKITTTDLSRLKAILVGLI